MTSIFASYVASDSAIIKPIALSLAIGVACDALLVRMTIVPAVPGPRRQGGLAPAPVAEPDPAQPRHRRRLATRGSCDDDQDARCGVRADLTHTRHPR